LEADPFLRRFERTAILACAAMAMIAFFVTRGGAVWAVAVLAGGALIGVSYWTIGSGVNALSRTRDAAANGAPGAPSLPLTVVKVTVRYALLALLAYVMIARLSLHPIGLLAGASSVVVAASIEAVRLLLKKS
jgi:ATP synthase I chain